MANSTPNLNRYLKQLSYKLRDPVASQEGLADGSLFTLAVKEDYLNRAYADLKLKLSSVVARIEKIFPDFYKIASKTIAAGTPEITPPSDSPNLSLTAPSTVSTTKLKNVSIPLSDFNLFERNFIIKDLYVSVKPNDSNYVYKQAGEIDAGNYFGAIYGQSVQYKSNDAAFKYFYAIVNGNIVFVGGENLCNQVTIFLESPIPLFTSNGDTGDIYMPKSYEKLFLTLAAYEAMLDKGDNEALTKAIAYDKTADKMLELIAVREKTIQKREADKNK